MFALPQPSFWSQLNWHSSRWAKFHLPLELPQKKSAAISTQTLSRPTISTLPLQEYKKNHFPHPTSKTCHPKTTMIYPPSKPLSSCPVIILLILLTCLCVLCQNLIYQPLPNLPAPPPMKRQFSQPSTSPPNRVIKPPKKDRHFHQQTSEHIADLLNRAFAKDLPFPPLVL